MWHRWENEHHDGKFYDFTREIPVKFILSNHGNPPTSPCLLFHATVAIKLPYCSVE